MLACICVSQSQAEMCNRECSVKPKPVAKKNLIQELTDEALSNQIEEAENEIAYLQDRLGWLRNERFYRKHPECRLIDNP